MTEHKFELKIEPKPGGGFIARSPDPKFPDFEGETREEVEAKIQVYIVQMVDQKLDQLHLGPLKAAIHTQFKVKHSTGTAAEQSASSPTQQISSSSHPIVASQQPSSSSGPIMMESKSGGATVAKIIVALLLAGLAFLYWQLHH